MAEWGIKRPAHEEGYLILFITHPKFLRNSCELFSATWGNLHFPSIDFEFLYSFIIELWENMWYGLQTHQSSACDTYSNTLPHYNQFQERGNMAD